MTRLAWAGLAAVALAAAVVVPLRWQQRRANLDLVARLDDIVPPPPSAIVPCLRPGAAPPTVLLVLGQSNAGNHGAEDEAPADGGEPRVTVFAAGVCTRLGDPLPGATGRHRSIWARLPAHLQRLGVADEVILAPLAVDATSISDWSRADGPLSARLRGLLAELNAAQLPPNRVLWQQGEADALLGTSADAYARGFEAVLGTLREAGVRAPVALAQSTVCGAADGRAVREAIQRLVARHADIQLGPDTDALLGPYRRGCHLSRVGLDAAASLWAAVIMRPLR